MILFFYCLSILFMQAFAALNCECGVDSLVKYNSDGLPKQLPWAVLVKVGKHRYCDGIILSETKIATWNCKINPNGTLNKVSIFTNRKTVVKDYYFKLPEFATRKIQRPSWKHLDGYDILQLDRPLKISAKKAPICIAKSVTDIDSPDKVAFRFERLDKKRLHQPFRDDFYTYSTVNKLRIAKEMNTVRGHAITYKSRKDGKWYFAGVEQRNVLVKQTNKLAQRIFVC